MGHSLVLLSKKPSLDLTDHLASLGVSKEGIDIMARKSETFVITFRNLDSRGANILKQEALARGGDCAVPWGGVVLEKEFIDGVLIINMGMLPHLIGKLRRQPFGLANFSKELEELKDNIERSIQRPWKELLEGGPPWVMGILNVTEDSFSDGGVNIDHRVAIETALLMEDDGASIIDIGGESTRPGAEKVSAEDELARVIPVIEGLKGKLSIPISIDTSKPIVARKALQAGASWINDVTGFSDPHMIDVAVEFGCPVITMHMQGTPGTMQQDPRYDDVVQDTIEFLRRSVQRLIDAGVDRDRITIDPGFGFGKTVEHNMTIVERIGDYRSLGQCILIGVSRKSTIGILTGKEVDDRMNGTLALHAICAQNGVDMIRVHDVAPHKDAMNVIPRRVLNVG